MLEIDENAVNGVGFPQCHSYGESSEDGLSVLPPHTKVIVTGNNRTKSVLVGLHGVVKKAVGLGGWHWLVLTNGLEVKLQRNALSVLEAPNGHEDHEDDPEYESLQWNNLDNGEFGQFGSDDTQKSQGRTNEPVQPIGSFQKARSRTLSDNSRSKGSVSRPQSSMKIDFSKLETAALLRYWRHFKLMNAIAIPNPSREQLVDAVGRHFMSQQLDELQVIVGFVRAAKRLKTVCN